MLLIILLTTHLLADFTFQTPKMAEEKEYKPKTLLLHALIYATTFGIVGFHFVKFESYILPFVIIIISHLLIDIIRIKGEKFLSRKYGGKLVAFGAFLFDQLLHISIVTLLYKFLIDNNTTVLYDTIKCNVTVSNYIYYIFLFVLLWTPTSVFIKKLFMYISNNNEDKDDTKSEVAAGRIIGKLERTIIAILVLLNQYSAIAFVLAAKSIARFKQLNNQDFAEKYLIGTLTSLSISLIATLLVKTLLQ